jgi:hypothetical protein
MIGNFKLNDEVHWVGGESGSKSRKAGGRNLYQAIACIEHTMVSARYGCYTIRMCPLLRVYAYDTVVKRVYEDIKKRSVLTLQRAEICLPYPNRYG